MRQLTCALLGDWYDATISGNSPDEVMSNGWKHVEEAHPDMDATMKDTSQEAKDEWSKKFRAQFKAAPEA